MSVVAEKPVREHLYEGMFLVDSGKFAMDPDGVTNDILAVLKRAAQQLSRIVHGRMENWLTKSTE